MLQRLYPFTLILGLLFQSSAWAQERLILLSGASTPVPMTEAEVQKLQSEIHAQNRCGGFMDVTKVWDRLQHAQPAYLPLFDFGDERNPSHGELVQTRMADLSVDRLRSTVTTLSAFQNRHYKSKTGVQSSKWIQDHFKALSAGRSDITVKTYAHDFIQPSVIATIQGNTRKDEIIVLGAHQDSINQWFQSRAPGADDDASGVATIMEIFRVLAQSGFKPDRTIQFIAYAGEEAGLLGSADIATQYAMLKTKVMAVVQFDMTMFPGKSRTLTFVSDHVNPELTTFLTKLQDAYVKKPWKKDKCDYACSDHASWTRAGFKSVFPTEASMDEMFKSIHTKNDLIEYLEVEYGLQFAQLGLAAAIELSLP